MQPWGQPHPQPQPQQTVAQHNTAFWHNAQAAAAHGAGGAGWVPPAGAHNPWGAPPLMMGHQPPPMMGAPQLPPPPMMTAGGATQPHSAPPQGAPTNAEPYVVYWTGIGRLDDAVCRRLLELCGLVQALALLDSTLPRSSQHPTLRRPVSAQADMQSHAGRP